MWGGLLDKAKEAAAAAAQAAEQIEKQLDESVAVNGAGVGAVAASSGVAAPVSGSGDIPNGTAGAGGIGNGVADTSSGAGGALAGGVGSVFGGFAGGLAGAAASAGLGLSGATTATTAPTVTQLSAADDDALNDGWDDDDDDDLYADNDEDDVGEYSQEKEEESNNGAEDGAAPKVTDAGKRDVVTKILSSPDESAAEVDTNTNDTTQAPPPAVDNDANGWDGEEEIDLAEDDHDEDGEDSGAQKSPPLFPTTPQPSTVRDDDDIQNDHDINAKEEAAPGAIAKEDGEEAQGIKNAAESPSQITQQEGDGEAEVSGPQQDAAASTSIRVGDYVKSTVKSNSSEKYGKGGKVEGVSGSGRSCHVVDIFVVGEDGTTRIPANDAPWRNVPLSQLEKIGNTEKAIIAADGDGWDEDDVADGSVSDVDLDDDNNVADQDDDDDDDDTVEENDTADAADIKALIGLASAEAEANMPEQQVDDDAAHEEQEETSAERPVQEEDALDDEDVNDEQQDAAEELVEVEQSAVADNGESIQESTPQPSAGDMAEVASLRAQVEQLQDDVAHREEQLMSKTEQFASMQDMFDKEREQLRNKVKETKEEAKRRIGKARERVEAMEQQLNDANNRLSVAGSGSSQKDEMIVALRSEGEALMKKQSQMEQSIRATKGEARGLKEDLAAETSAKEKALAKIEELERLLKSTREELTGARKGETRAGKLDQDLAQLREETEKKANAILGLEQKVKELKAENKLLTAEVDNAKKEATLEKERESNDLKRERDDMLSDLETKLRTSEREAAVREDALRHEVGELRKRWQDAVRRADELSIDVQQSSAPLMRQLESTERQHRARAAAWAELEMKLRSDLEDNIVHNEKLTKERTELTTSLSRTERASTEKDEELAQLRSDIDEANATITELRESIKQLDAQNSELQQRCQDVEAEADETVTKIRSEMSDTLVMSEERYQSQVASLERKIKEEKDLAQALEAKLEDLVKSSSAMPLSNGTGAVTSVVKETPRKKLQSATGQADILQSALAGFDDGGDGSEDDTGDDESAGEEDNFGGSPSSATGPGSFAAMEQLSQGLKGAKLELQALRKQLTASEGARESLVADLADARAASEKLPLFEAKVADLTEQVRMKDIEIQGLTEDLQDVKNLYRGQLDMLLEVAAEEKKEEEASVPVQDDDAPPIPAQTNEKEENGWAEIADPSVLQL